MNEKVLADKEKLAKQKKAAKAYSGKAQVRAKTQKVS